MLFNACNFKVVCICCLVGRPWPVAFGAGVGLGMGYANCQHDFQHPGLLHGGFKKVNIMLLNFSCTWAYSYF